VQQHCDENGLRLTNKRKQVLTLLLQSEKALSAYELVDSFKVTFSESIPAMSVYRILEFLEHEQMVHKLDSMNKYVACAHISCDSNHSHSQFLICEKCEKVKEVNLEGRAWQQLQKTAHDKGFLFIKPQLEMNCLCNDCMTSES